MARPKINNLQRFLCCLLLFLKLKTKELLGLPCGPPALHKEDQVGQRV